jgi:hypothetical protein
MKLIHPERIRRREHTARNKQLDVVRSMMKRLANATPHLVHTVDCRGQRSRIGTRARACLAWRTHVAVAPGLGQRLAANEQARTLNQSIVNGAGETDVAASCIPHCGKSLLQHALQVQARELRHVGRRHAVEARDVEARTIAMEMGIDHAGHECAISQIDQLIVGPHVYLPVHANNPARLYSYGYVRNPLLGSPVKYLSIGKQNPFAHASHSRSLQVQTERRMRD